jgi:hypothetical protein
MGFSTYRTGFRALEGSLQLDAGRPAAVRERGDVRLLRDMPPNAC